MNYKKKMIFFLLIEFFTLLGASRKSMAGDQMSLSFFNDMLKVGGDFYLRFETRTDYYTQDGRCISDHDTSSRQRLSLDFTPKRYMGFMFTVLRTNDWNNPHPYLFPYSYDHEADVQQAYIHVNRPMNLPLSLWVGRKEVAYLNQRLIGHSYGWTNKPISFDGGGISLDGKRAKIDVFYLNKVLRDLEESRAFNDKWFGKPADLYGIWLTLKNIPIIQKVDSYVFVNEVNNGDNSITPGIRIYGKNGPVDYDVDFTIQLGKKYVNKERLERHAHAFYADVGYRFDIPQRLRIALQYNYASGDGDPNDHSYKTFDQLYGCVHGKYGLMDFFSWQNMHDIYLYGNSSITEDLKVLCGVHSFWLANTHDGWFNAYKKIQRCDSTGKANSYVGSEFDLLLTYSFLKNFKLKGFYGHFFAGSYVKSTGKSNDADYTYCQLEYQF